MGYNTWYNLKWKVVDDKPQEPPTCKCGASSVGSPFALQFCLQCGEPILPLDIDELIGDYLEEALDNYALDRYGAGTDNCKWYDWHTDMLKMSRKFHGVLFTLHGEGEEAEDIWDTHYLDGKSQRVIARIVLDEFDETKLK